MSKTNVFNQPGIEPLRKGHDLPVAVKVTGRNMHAVSLVASISGEALNRRSIVSAFFDSDGSLSHVELTDKDNSVIADAGDYLLLSDDRQTVIVADEQHYKEVKAGFEFASPLFEFFDRVNNLAKGKS